MDHLRGLALALVITTAGLAGCFGDDGPPDARRVSASGGVVSDGWAYDGQGLSNANAQFEGQANDPANTGAFNLSFEHAGSSWTIVFDQFSGEESYKDGGVNFDLVEHGDSGVADTSVPRILALIAAWGSATVERDGQAYPDPGTGQTGPWSAHLMVSDTTVRGEDGLIARSDGTTPYDPNDAGDARTVAGDPQVLFWVQAPSGPDAERAPARVDETFTFQGPESTQTVEVPAGPWASGTINVTAGPAAGPLGAGELAVRLLDSEGNELEASSATVTPGEPVDLTFPLPDVAGPLTVELTGQGFFTVQVTATVTYDDHAFLVVTMDEVTVEDL